jgi:hypothetical protein
MTELAKKITVDMQNKKLLINDVEFPWFVTEEGFDVEGLLANNEIPTVGFRIFAETVEVIPADG